MHSSATARVYAGPCPSGGRVVARPLATGSHARRCAWRPSFRTTRERRRTTAARGGAMISGVRSVGIYVGDQDRAKTFWTETMGFELLGDTPMGQGEGAPRWIEVAP